jgi:hypothetical protein
MAIEELTALKIKIADIEKRMAMQKVTENSAR